MKRLKLIVIILITNTIGTPISAQSRKSVETSTDILVFVPAVSGFVTTLVKKDYIGSKQIVLSGATNLAATLILKQAIKKERPDMSDYHSFPSGHTSIAFQGASFIQQRYGWKYGIPAYLVSSYVGWGRIYAKKHDLWDVLGGAAVGTVSTYIFSTPFAQKRNITFSPTLMKGEYPAFYASIIF